MKVNSSFYSEFAKEKLILRDHLAIDRTILANENAFLAYIRTCLALLVSGASLLKFFDENPIHMLGYSLIVVGLLILLVGISRFRKMRKEIDTIRTL